MLKLQPVYEISLDGVKVGYIQNKNEFEDIVNKKFNDNEEENIAFVDFNMETNYEFKLVEKQVKTNEEEVMLAIKEKADITYFQYAINVNGVEKEYVNSKEKAEEIVKLLKQEVGEQEYDISIAKVYKRELQQNEPIEIASISKNVVTKIKEEKQEEEKREKSTINGVYISVVPVQGNITSRYGAREAIRDHAHRGLDIATKTGTPIKAASDGTIKYSGTMSGYGNLIIISHGNGITTYYGHCSKLYKKEGEKVKAGDVIAAVGSTGRSTGPHLHFEIRKDGEYVNPAKYLF